LINGLNQVVPESIIIKVYDRPPRRHGLEAVDVVPPKVASPFRRASDC
jgi:hypothetical protein